VRAHHRLATTGCALFIEVRTTSKLLCDVSSPSYAIRGQNMNLTKGSAFVDQHHHSSNKRDPFCSVTELNGLPPSGVLLVQCALRLAWEVCGCFTVLPCSSGEQRRLWLSNEWSSATCSCCAAVGRDCVVVLERFWCNDERTRVK
jgi:hypothetical protein